MKQWNMINPILIIALIIKNFLKGYHIIPNAVQTLNEVVRAKLWSFSNKTKGRRLFARVEDKVISWRRKNIGDSFPNYFGCGTDSQFIRVLVEKRTEIWREIFIPVTIFKCRMIILLKEFRLNAIVVKHVAAVLLIAVSTTMSTYFGSHIVFRASPFQLDYHKLTRLSVFLKTLRFLRMPSVRLCARFALMPEFWGSRKGKYSGFYSFFKSNLTRRFGVSTYFSISELMLWGTIFSSWKTILLPSIFRYIYLDINY